MGWLQRKSGRLKQISNLQARCADFGSIFGYSGLWRLETREVMYGGIGNDGTVCANMPSIGVFPVSTCKALQTHVNVRFGNLWFLGCAFAGVIPSLLKLGKRQNLSAQ